MASSSNKGAAEEPEPEPGPPSPSPSPSAAAAAPPYDPREYQPAHPDDRGCDGKPSGGGHGGGWIELTPRLI